MVLHAGGVDRPFLESEFLVEFEFVLRGKKLDVPDTVFSAFVHQSFQKHFAESLSLKIGMDDQVHNQGMVHAVRNHPAESDEPVLNIN